jgi:acetylglutamate kinase
MDQLVIVKIGGNIVDDDASLQLFLKSFAEIKQAKILVHGGGKLATRLAETMGIQQQMVEGRRITDAETLKVVTMVYAGYINKSIVAQLQQYGANSIGLTGADANAVLAHKRKGKMPDAIDYGFVGDIDQVNAAFFNKLIQQSLVPVVSPITHDGKGQLLNTNADTIAQSIATAMSSFYETILVYSFEKKGVLLDINNADSVIPIIDSNYYQTLKANQQIFAGMIPKLDNAFVAIEQGVAKVIIGNAAELDQLIIGQAGTTIQNG